MAHLAGGKVTSSHTTVTDSAKPIAEHLRGNSRVKKIVLGKIDNSGGSGRGRQRVKIIDERSSILISVSGNGSDQKLRVYLKSGNRQNVKVSLARFVRNNGYELSFLDRRQ